LFASFVEDTLQGALKMQRSVLPWRKTVERLRITFCKNDGACDFVLPPWRDITINASDLHMVEIY